MNDTTSPRLHEADTGSAAAQASLLTAKIAHLAQHLKTHPKDNHSRRGLLAMVNKRRKQLRYLKRTRPEMHAGVLGALGLRK
ncbi:MAG: 30S ribosomal protein S15 [Gammaproteobacteria bacterium]